MADATSFYTLAGAIVSGIVTISTLLIRSRSRERLEAIKTGTQRAAEIVRDEVEAYGVEARDLSPADQFALATSQIKARLSRLLIIAVTFLIALIILAFMAVTLLVTGRSQEHASKSKDDEHSPKNDDRIVSAGNFRFIRCLPIQRDPTLEIEPGIYQIQLYKNPSNSDITARACFGDQGNGAGSPTVCRENGETIELRQTARLFGMETNLYIKNQDLDRIGLMCAIANDGSGYTMRATGPNGVKAFEILLTMTRSPPRAPVSSPHVTTDSKPRVPAAPAKVVPAPTPVACSYGCSGSYPGEGLDLKDASKYILTIIESRTGGAQSFTLHNNGGSSLINVTAGERDAVVHGPGRVTICSTVPGTGGGCATHCTETPIGARLFSDQYSATVSISCR